MSSGDYVQIKPDFQKKKKQKQNNPDIQITVLLLGVKRVSVHTPASGTHVHVQPPPPHETKQEKSRGILRHKEKKDTLTLLTSLFAYSIPALRTTRGKAGSIGGQITALTIDNALLFWGPDVFRFPWPQCCLHVLIGPWHEGTGLYFTQNACGHLYVKKACLKTARLPLEGSQGMSVGLLGHEAHCGCPAFTGQPPTWMRPF